MTRRTKKQAHNEREGAIASGRGPVGRALQYALNREEREAKRYDEAAQSEAAREVGFSFGARVERQFLALARFLAAWEEFIEDAGPAALTYEAEQAEAKAQSRANIEYQVRKARQAGIHLKVTENPDGSLALAVGEFALDKLPDPGWWERCAWEQGRFDLAGIEGLDAIGEGIAIASIPGDRGAVHKHGERAREIRYYHPQGTEEDPTGDAYTPVRGLPPNLPAAGLKRLVRHCVRTYGIDPQRWPGIASAKR